MSVLTEVAEPCGPSNDVLYLAISEPGFTYCNSTFDSFSCWPTTRGGDVAKIACPDISVADPSGKLLI